MYRHSMEELNTRSVLDTYMYPAQFPDPGSVVEIVSSGDQRIADVPSVLTSRDGSSQGVPFQYDAERILLLFPNDAQCTRSSGDISGVATIDYSLDLGDNQTLRIADESQDPDVRKNAELTRGFLQQASTKHSIEVADLRIFNPEAIYPGGGIKPLNATKSMAIAIAQDLLLAADKGKVRYCTALCDQYSLGVLGRYGVPLHYLTDSPDTVSTKGGLSLVWFDVEQLRDSLQTPYTISAQEFRADFDKIMAWQHPSARPRDVERISARPSTVAKVQLGRLALEQQPLDERLAPYSPDFDDYHLRKKLLDQYKGSKSYALFRIDGKDPLADACRAVEARGFADELVEDGRFPDPRGVASELYKHYARYDSRSTFLYLMDMGSGEAMGAVRVVEGALKTLDDLYAHWGRTAREAMEAHDINPVTSWDIASLVVEEKWRRSDAGFILNNALSNILQENSDIESWTTVLVSKYFKMLTRFCGIPFRRILDLQDEKHMGELSVPAFLHTKDIPDHMRKTRPEEYKRLWLGEGLEYDTVELRR